MANEFVVQLQGAEDFDKKVLKAEGTVLVDFWASWCGPCRMLAPVLDEVAGEFAEKAVFVKVDVDANGDVAQKYGIMSIPNVIVFKNGEPAANSLGYVPAAALKSFLGQNL